MAGDNLARKLPSRGTNRGRSKVPSSYRRAFGGPSNVPMQNPSKQATSGLSTAGQLQQAETTKTPPAGSNKPTSAADVAKKENAADNRMKYNPTKGPSSPSGKRAGIFFRNNKGKLIGGAAAVVMGGGLLTGGIFMSGPVQFLHALEFIGDIANMTQKGLVAARTAKTLNTIRNSGKAIQNTRINSVASFWSNSYEKKLAKSGISIEADGSNGRFSSFNVTQDGKTTIADIQRKFPDSDVISDGGKFKISPKSSVSSNSARSKWWKATMRTISDMAPNAPRAGPIMSRILGVKNLMVGFHPIHNMRANNVKKLENWLIRRSARRIMKRNPSLFNSVDNVITKYGRSIEKKVAKSTAMRIGKAILGKVPVIGWISSAVDFGFTLWFKRAAQVAATSFALGVSMAKATELMAMADQIKYGDANGSLREPDPVTAFFDDILIALGISNASAEEENFTLAEQLGLASEANFYREIPFTSDDALAGYSDEEIENLKTSGTGNLHVGASVGSSFWQNSLVNAEIDGTRPADKAALGDVPKTLLDIAHDTMNSGAAWTEDIINTAIESFGIGLSPDTFECEGQYSLDNIVSDCEFDDSGLTPREIGAEAMYGARVTEKENMRALGGVEVDPPTATAIEKERREAVDAEFNSKPWYARLFDVKDYRSGIATLARDSGWNMNGDSVIDVFKNIAQTVVSTPRLIAKNTSRVTTSSYAYSYNMQSWYNIGAMGYSDDDFENLPDFVDAANEVQTQLDSLKKNFIDNIQPEVDSYNLSHATNTSIDELTGERILIGDSPEYEEGFTPVTPSGTPTSVYERCLADASNKDDVKIGYGNEDSESSFDVETWGGTGVLGDIISMFPFSKYIVKKAVTGKYTCGEQFLSIILPQSGLKINGNGEVIPLSNSGSAEEDSLCEKNKDCDPKMKTYSYQESYTDDGLSLAIRAYIMDYQIIMAGSALMMDGSTESEESLNELGSSRSEFESSLNDGFTKLVAGEWGSL